jgi:UPF0755 protein
MRASHKGHRSANWVTALGVLVLIAFAGRLMLDIEVSPISPGNRKTAQVQIRHGERSAQIADTLVAKGLARNTLAVDAALLISGENSHLQAGTYALSPSMPLSKMIEIIAAGKTDSILVVVPEGFTIGQISARLESKKLADPLAFDVAASTEGETYVFADGFAPPRNLEGYLFPLTYNIVVGSSAHVIVQSMVTQFDAHIVQPHPEIRDWSQIVTLASLVEREAKVDQDRPLIASVYYNRLKAGMPLQCDATVQYALPEHKARLLYSDLRVDSPYNTYLHHGLPPGPICNPGRQSIEAAICPAKTNYLFYVAGPNGRHIFSRTLAQQDRQIALLKPKT